jgi:hypothetical protein
MPRWVPSTVGLPALELSWFAVKPMQEVQGVQVATLHPFT